MAESSAYPEPQQEAPATPDNQIPQVNDVQQGTGTQQAREAKKGPAAAPSEPLDENFLKNFFWTLLSTIIWPIWRPFRDWILGLSWPFRVIAAVIIGLLVFSGMHPLKAWEKIEIAGRFPMAMTHGKTLPVSPSQLDQLNHTIDVVSERLDTVFSQLEAPDPEHNSWTIGQMTVATRGLPIHAEGTKIITALQTKLDGCNCWKQNASDPYPHIDSTNWVLLALTRFPRPLDERDIQSLVAAQNPDGWWPSSVEFWSESSGSPASQNEKNASTYSTAMAVEALQDTLTRGHFEGNPALKAQVEFAVKLGANWLVGKESHARWKDFPNAGAEAKEPLGLSGLVLHVLHHTNHDNPQMDKDWLDNLPDDNLGAQDNENCILVVNIDGKKGSVKDSVRHMRLGWSIVATRDAYHNGSVMQRMRALNWIGARTPTLLDEARKIPHERPFESAELLIALRYLRGDSSNGYSIF
jgi:hypothetical protein